MTTKYSNHLRAHIYAEIAEPISKQIAPRFICVRLRHKILNGASYETLANEFPEFKFIWGRYRMPMETVETRLTSAADDHTDETEVRLMILAMCITLANDPDFQNELHP